MKTINEFNAGAIPFRIFLLDNNNTEAVEKYLKLFYDCFGFRKHLDASWYNWFYTQSPLGSPNNYILEDRQNNKWIGAYSLSRSAVSYHSKETVYGIGVGVNGMVDSFYRGRGLYSKIIETALTDSMLISSYTLLHGKNIATVKGHINCGWERYKRLFFYQKEPSRIAAPETTRKVETFADLGEVNFPALNTGYSSFVSRSEDYLNWRFLKRPHKKYKIIIHYNASGQARGYVVLSFYTGNDITRCQVVDYGYPDKSVLYSLLQKAENTAAENGANIIDLWVDEENTQQKEVVSKNSFIKTDEYYEMLVYPQKSNIFDKGIKITLADLDAV